jgi:hypothetical protein
MCTLLGGNLILAGSDTPPRVKGNGREKERNPIADIPD